MQAHKEFVPSRVVTVPFMTILRERSYKEPSTENLPFRSNFIYYVDQVEFFAAGAYFDAFYDRRIAQRLFYEFEKMFGVTFLN